MHKLTLYTARGCSLCGPVRRRLESVRAEIPFELEEVDITDVPELEREYREWLPVVEIDGRRRFTYRLQVDAFRRAVAQASAEA